MTKFQDLLHSRVPSRQYGIMHFKLHWNQSHVVDLAIIPQQNTGKFGEMIDLHNTLLGRLMNTGVCI